MRVLVALLFGAVAFASPHPTKIKAKEAQEHFLSPEPILRIEGVRGFEGVSLMLVVDNSGRVRSATPQRASSLNSQAVELAMGLTFRPFIRHGKPVEIQYDEYVRVLPPERMRPRHVAFPLVDNLSSVEFWLSDVHITGDGTVSFAGRLLSGRVSESSIQGLLASFESADFFSLDDEYSIAGHDFPSWVVGIRVGPLTKTVFDYAGEHDGMPHSVKELERQIQAIVDSVRSSSLAHPK